MALPSQRRPAWVSGSSAGPDRALDGLTVSLARREREQNVQHHWRQRDLGLRVGAGHDCTISVTDIVRNQTILRGLPRGGLVEELHRSGCQRVLGAHHHQPPVIDKVLEHLGTMT